MVVNLYEKFQMDPSWSLSDIQLYLQRKLRKWENIALTRQDETSQKKYEQVKKAVSIFSSQSRREAYDTKLHEFLNPKPQADPRKLKCEEYFNKAKGYYENAQYDLAEQAIQIALANRSDDETEVLFLAACIFNNLKRTQEALNIINNCIVLESNNSDFHFFKAQILKYDLILSASEKFRDEDKIYQKIIYLNKYLFTDIFSSVEHQTIEQELEILDFVNDSLKYLHEYLPIYYWQRFDSNQIKQFCSQYRAKALSSDIGTYIDRGINVDTVLDIPFLENEACHKYVGDILKKDPTNSSAQAYRTLFQKQKKSQVSDLTKLKIIKENKQKIGELTTERSQMYQKMSKGFTIKDTINSSGCVIPVLFFLVADIAISFLISILINKVEYFDELALYFVPIVLIAFLVRRSIRTTGFSDAYSNIGNQIDTLTKENEQLSKSIQGGVYLYGDVEKSIEDKSRYVALLEGYQKKYGL